MAARCLCVGDVPPDRVLGRYVVPFTFEADDYKNKAALLDIYDKYKAGYFEEQIENAARTVMTSYSYSALMHTRVIPTLQLRLKGFTGIDSPVKFERG